MVTYVLTHCGFSATVVAGEGYGCGFWVRVLLALSTRTRVHPYTRSSMDGATDSDSEGEVAY
jgi:hypothetical protein